MSQFSRRARWLESLFPPSVAPRAADPTILSDDVSLVQSYDAGGYGISAPQFNAVFDTVSGAEIIEVPRVGIFDYRGLLGIVTQTDIFSISENLVCRLLSVTYVTDAGIGAEFVSLNATPPAGSGLGNHQVQYSDTFNNTVSPGQRRLFTNVPPVLLPGTQLNVFFNAGDVASSSLISIAMIVAPLGTIFTV